MDTSLYIHIPFCKSRCIYCDFYSTTALPQRQQYVDALCEEIAQRAHGLRARTIYIGGGTPSQLTEGQLCQIFDSIALHCIVEEGAEVTIEANPDDVTEQFAALLSRLPVNRVSMGVQTFDDERLHFLSRRHCAGQAREAVARLRSAGISNISIDLMFGFPGETLEQWQSDISEALKLKVPHLSAYSLMYEEGTRLTQMRDSGVVEELPDTLTSAMYSCLCDRLAEAGYEHYEISNFAMPGYRSRHNSSYWDATPYVGVGAAAHSYDGASLRSFNTPSLYEYLRQASSGAFCPEEEHLTEGQLYDERVMTRLRTAEGLDMEALRRDFGASVHDYCLRMARPHLQRGLLRLSEGRLSLTRDGLFVSDDVMSDLMAE